MDLLVSLYAMTDTTRYDTAEGVEQYAAMAEGYDGWLRLFQAFLDRYAERRPDAELLRLDAVTIDTTKRFDCVYSNKALHHLTVDDLTRSLRQQTEVIRSNGLLLHGLWAGDKTENHHGLHSQQYTAETFAATMPPALEIVECTPYQEMTADDSLRLVLRPNLD